MFESDLDNIINDKIFKDLEPVVAGLGFEIVELKIGRAKKETHITVVIYKSDGVGIDDCTRVSKTIHPRLEILNEIENLILKVTSPGINRVLKDRREYRIFHNRGVKILMADSNEWTGGIIKEAGNTGFFLQTKEGIMNIEYTSIKKAKLDYTEEVGDT